MRAFVDVCKRTLLLALNQRFQADFWEVLNLKIPLNLAFTAFLKNGLRILL
jgi:hypothetical protein